MRKGIVVVRQNGIKDCGVSCLLSIIRYYKGNLPIERLRDMTKTDKNGTSAFHLVECANNIGFSSKGLKCNNIEDLKKLNLPCIAHLVINKSYKHYVVIYNVNYKRKIITIMDPAKGIVKMSFDEFDKIWSKIIIELYPLKKILNINTKNNVLNILKHIIYNNQKVSISIFALSLFVTIFSIVNSYYFKIIVDNFVKNSMRNFYIISFIFVFILLFKNISDFFRNQLLLCINEKIDFCLITQTFKHIICLPYNYFKNKTTGEIISRINDLNYVKEMISKVALSVFVDIILVLFASIILFSINQVLFLISLLILLLYILCVIVFSPFFKKNILINQEKQGIINSYLVESINGYETIKALNMENKTSNKLENKYADFLNHSFKTNKIFNVQILFKNLIDGLGFLAIMFVGYLFVLDNKMSIGDLITFNSLLIYFLEPIKNVLELEPLIRYSNASLKRINELFEIEPENLQIDDKFTGNNIKGDICIQNLNYSINDKDLILKNINLQIDSGDKVLIVGDSGSGKSTFIKLLLNYTDVSRDSILIDNKDINDYNKKELRNNIAYVSQNETLFTDSIYNNIIIDKDDINYDEFLDVCKLTEVDNIVKSKYLGYDTLLEEGGFNISGGEKNRIILSRILLKKFNVLLLDEALNEVDINMERRILKRLFDKNSKKTIIIVSHRLENMDLFDKVVRFSDGQIKEIIKKEM